LGLSYSSPHVRVGVDARRNQIASKTTFLEENS
jgi:hypothetical protein